MLSRSAQRAVGTAFRAAVAQRPTRLSATRRALHAGAAVHPFESVLVSDALDNIAIELLEARGIDVANKPGLSPEDLLVEIAKHDALIVRSGTQVTPEVLAAAKKLKFVGRAGTGVDNINIPAATKKGVIVMNVPGGNTNAAAELAFAMIMAVSRNIAQGNESLRAGRWDRKKYGGYELSGKTIGIIGTGRIGQSVAKWCQAFGMRTIGYDAVMSAEAMAKYRIESADLDDIWAQSDFITFHTPLNDQTRDLINQQTLAKCKDGVFIVNCARGGIVNEEALLEALDSGKVRGAALDVFSSEPPTGVAKKLVEHPAVVSTPHLGASTAEAQTNVARDIAQFVADGLEGKGLKGVINAPAPEWLTNPKLKPFSLLSERLGALQSELVSGKVQQLHLTVSGDLVGKASELIMSSMLKGFLGKRVADVNLINALHTAEEQGIKLVTSVVSSTEAQNKVLVECTFDDRSTIGHRSVVSGTVSREGVPRLLHLDGYDLQLEMPFTENLLLVKVNDQPGAIAGITAALADGVNIGSISLGRGVEPAEGSVPVALAVITVDGAVPSQVVRTIQDMDMTRFAAFAGLGEQPAAVVATEGRPLKKPASPNFCSGPTKKRPGYVVGNLRTTPFGRSHRAPIGKNRLKKAISDSKRLLGVPEDYHLGIVPASDTGAFEMAMWSMLGQRPVDVCFWESFGKGWAKDCEVLGLDYTKHEAAYGELPDLSKTNPDNDILFTWNGTTSGVRVPDADWISDNRTGLTFCDATSAVFAQDLDWDKLDVTTYSWQKALGGEGGHGTIVLSPRAVERLQTYTPPRPLPKIFRLTKEVDEQPTFMKDVFEGNVINTPSMLVVEDYIDALTWVERVGGVEELQRRCDRNLKAVQQFVKSHPGFSMLAQSKAITSNTSVCLTVDLSPEQLTAFKALLEAEGVAYDIGSYRDAPAGLRVWCGPTVDTEDVSALMNWFSWAHDKVKA